ncbi:MAG: SemiSWEET transporter [Candidatus Bathyarchaeota archaeon]|nr:SemiSWEET transporter [Candidatus Bathyarchaeota archaeon]
MGTTEVITILGLAAAVFSTISLLPQILKVWKTKSAKDVSSGMFRLFCGGVILWFTYGIIVKDLPIIMANAAAFAQSVTMLAFKTKFK